MATTTPKWGLAIPQMTDPPAGGSQIAALGTSVDGALTQFGSLAARASVAHHVGLHYYAQDTDQLFLSDGTNWKEVPLVSVGTADIANNAITAAKIEAQQAWQTASVTQIGSNVIKYYKNSLGEVIVRGDALATIASIAPGAPLWTFPAGYRPITSVTHIVQRLDSGGAIHQATIDTNGQTSFNLFLGSGVPSGAQLSFGAIRFRAEN